MTAMNKSLRRRQLAIEPMENRLLLSGTQPVDLAVFNQDSLNSTPYAVIATDVNQVDSDAYLSRNNFVWKIDDTTLAPNQNYFRSLSNDSVSLDSIGASGQLSGSTLTVGDTQFVSARILPQIQTIMPVDSGTRYSLSGSYGFGDSTGYSPIESQFTDSKNDGGPLDVNGSSRGTTLNNDTVPGFDPLVISTEPTTTGQVTNHPTTPPLSNEGGMIAVSEVLASLQRESAALGGADAKLAARRHAAGNELEASAGVTVSSNRLSGELARAVSFEVMDGQPADGSEHAKIDDSGLSANVRLSIEAATDNLAPASEEINIHVAANDAATDSAPNSAQYDQVATVTDGSLPIRLASFVTSNGAAANSRQANEPTANAADHALVEAAAIPAENLGTDPRSEVFSRWTRRDALYGQRDDERHGLPWDMAPVLIVLGLERYLAARHHSEEDEHISPRPTRRESLSVH
jgi:hypothetical protein